MCKDRNIFDICKGKGRFLTVLYFERKCFLILSAKDVNMTIEEIEVQCCEKVSAVRRTLWERLTKTNHKEVTDYKGLLKRYTEELLMALRCDFLEDVRVFVN